MAAPRSGRDSGIMRNWTKHDVSEANIFCRVFKVCIAAPNVLFFDIGAEVLLWIRRVDSTQTCAAKPEIDRIRADFLWNLSHSHAAWGLVSQ